MVNITSCVVKLALTKDLLKLMQNIVNLVIKRIVPMFPIEKFEFVWLHKRAKFLDQSAIRQTSTFICRPTLCS